jgi:hypothetical protein
MKGRKEKKIIGHTNSEELILEGNTIQVTKENSEELHNKEIKSNT